MFECLCFNIYCSNKYIYVQFIDDIQGYILVFVSLCEESVLKSVNKFEQLKEVGKFLVECVKVVNIDKVVFDCGGYLYYGCVKFLVEGVCEGGL